MQKNLYLKNEKVLSQTRKGDVLFTNQRIRIERSGVQQIIPLEQIDEITISSQTYNILLISSVISTLAMIYSIASDKFLSAAGSLVLTAVLIAGYFISRKRVLNIHFNVHSLLSVNIKNLVTEPQALRGLLQEARFELQNQQHRSSSKDQKQSSESIKISA